MAQVRLVLSVIDRIHLSSAAISVASFFTVSGLPILLPAASTATATWTCLCGSIPTVTIERSSPSANRGRRDKARALTRGQTYCELTAQQASIKSLPVRALALRAAVDISTEGLAAHVL